MESNEIKGYFYKHKNEPLSIIDVIDRAEEYISEMREKKDMETIPKYLKQYAWEYFREVKLDEDKLKSLAIYVIDKIYRITAEMTISDVYTKSFYAKILPFFWDTFQNRGIDVFFVVDNTFNNDGKFELIIELFSLSGIAVVTPNGDRNLEYAEVEKQVKDYIAPVRMIMYIERDDSVNYLDKIIEIAKKSNYLCIFRNKPSKDPHIEIISSETNS